MGSIGDLGGKPEALVTWSDGPFVGLTCSLLLPC